MEGGKNFQINEDDICHVFEELGNDENNSVQQDVRRDERCNLRQRISDVVTHAIFI